jgi:hypothetical protein
VRVKKPQKQRFKKKRRQRRKKLEVKVDESVDDA